MINGYMDWSREESLELSRICSIYGYRIEEFASEAVPRKTPVGASIMRTVGVARRSTSLLREYDASASGVPWTAAFEKDLAAGQFGLPEEWLMSQPEDFSEFDRGLEIHVRLFFDAAQDEWIVHANVLKHSDDAGETLDCPVRLEPNRFARREEARQAGFGGAKALVTNGIDWSQASPKRR